MSGPRPRRFRAPMTGGPTDRRDQRHTGPARTAPPRRL